MFDISKVIYLDQPSKDNMYTREVSNSLSIDAIQSEFDKLLDQDPILNAVFLKLQKKSIRGVIFGGWVRDQYMSATTSVELMPRDIDVVVDLPANVNLEDIMPNECTETVFGGMVLKTTTTTLDIWDVRDTYLIKSLSMNPGLDVLPSTTVFSINSVVFYPAQLNKTPKLLESGFLDAIKSSEITFQSSRIPLPLVQVARAAMYSAKLSFDIGQDVQEFIRSVCTASADVKEVLEGLDSYCPLEIKNKAISIFQKVLGGQVVNDVTETIFFKHCLGVFEGGGVRASALAGAYEAATLSGVNFGRVAGTSAGSIVAALISSGANPEFILDALKSKSFLDFMRPVESKGNAFGATSSFRNIARFFWGRLGVLLKVWQDSGVYSSSEVQKWLDELLSKQLSVPSPVKFKDLKLPLYVVASDIIEGKSRIWSKESTPNDSVAFAVRCSCSIPFYFQPVSDGTSLLVDGGMISNLPSWVFANPDSRESLSRILCFRLQESTNSKVDNLTDFMQCLVSTVVGGGTEIQLNLQPNVYTVNIPTGEYKATDFDRVDVGAKEWLRRSGFDSVNKFISGERMAVRNRPESMTYSGFDEKLLLLVQYLCSATTDVLIVSSNSYWLYFIFPALAFAIQRGIVVNVILKPSIKDPNEKHEAHRQRQLISVGVGVNVLESLPFDGFIFDRNSVYSTAVISTAEGFLGQDYRYGDERMRVYTSAYDAPVIHALNMLLSTLELAKAGIIDVSLKKIESESVFNELKKIRQYRESSFTLEDINISDDIYGLDLHIKEFRLTQVMQLTEAFKAAGIELFSPAAFHLGDEISSIITPPVLERIGDKLILIEGSTRFYYALKNNLKTIKAIVVTGVTAQLPASPRKISMLNLASDTINSSELYEKYNGAEFRPIEQVLHPLLEG